jgi:DNA-binding MarR family transcriptional regulator
MDLESYRALNVLEELAADPSLTQRRLAKKLRVALGLTNLMIRRLIAKGEVQVVSLSRNRIRYLLTPKGLAEKSRLTYEYLEYSLFLYRRVREVLKEHLSRAARSGGVRVVVFGTGEIAEIAYLTIQELGLELAGVIDDASGGRTFFGRRVRRLDELASLAFDCGVVTTLEDGFRMLRQRLQELGVPEDRILVIERDRARIRAVSLNRDARLAPLEAAR